MMQWFPGFFKNQDGATAVEYALMVTFIAIVIVGAVTLLGQNTGASFNPVAAAIGGAVP